MRVTPTFQKLGLYAGVLSVALFGGCAAKQTAVKDLSQADLAVKESQQTEAAKYAPLEARAAQDKLEEARKKMDGGEYEDSSWASEEAIVNAQLAQAKTREAKTHQFVEDAKQGVDTLQEETRRNRDERVKQ